MKEMETQHMSIRYFRIGYNFVICNDGNIYEGNLPKTTLEKFRLNTFFVNL